MVETIKSYLTLSDPPNYLPEFQTATAKNSLQLCGWWQCAINEAIKAPIILAADSLIWEIGGSVFSPFGRLIKAELATRHAFSHFQVQRHTHTHTLACVVIKMLYVCS